jgi:hypothetical protein
MYHPPGTNEAALEWLELRNQHAVDIDLSGWRLDAGVDYTFPEGTLIRAGGYLVLASSPADLKAATGLTNIVGPFRNRLSNAGEQLVLRNNDGRKIDELTYGTELDWPVAPDGAGPSLAKRGANLRSADPANWRASYETGGTPGRANFSAAPPPALAFNEHASATNADFWLELINRGATNVNLGGCVVARFGGATNRESTLPARALAPGALLQLTRAELGFGADPSDRLVLYTPGKSNVLDALVAKREPRARWPDGSGRWLFPSALSPGASNVFAFHDELVINEIFYHAPPMPAHAAVFANGPLMSVTNEWRWFAAGAEPEGNWRLPAYDDSGWARGRGVFLAPTNLNLAALKGTRLPLTNDLGQRIVSFYFRAPFTFTGATNDLALALRPLVDDGAVFYLNGAEVYRLNLPVTNILYRTLALTNVGLPAFGATVALPCTNLAQGVNWLAAEVHQVVTNSSDVAFGCELSAARQLAPAEPFRESDEAWVELFNRGSNTVSLAGWRLDEGIDFRFDSNTVIAPGGYLVVAKDVDLMRSNHPGIAVAGPFANQLSRKGELIVLKDPLNNPADQVRYDNGWPWPEYADAGGSSLELRDPRADRANPAAWAASDESAKAAWQTYTFRGLSAPGQAGEPTLWHELALCLVDGAGEVLLDDISVLENPATAPRQLIRNGAFAGGSAAHWRFLGNHRHSRVEPEPGAPGNYVLRLVATGAGEYQGNQIETTLTNNTSIVEGREYEISFRAKWVAGKGLLNSRLYFNRLAHTVALPMPARHGTPGARNSRFEANLGPTFQNLAHAPVVPKASQAVTVSVEADDPDGVGTLTLRYSVNGGAWQSAPMTRQEGRRFAGTIPGQAAAAIVQFYVEGTDGLGAKAFAPAAGTDSRALYGVQDNQAATNGAHNLRLVMTRSDAAYMHTGTNTLSNELLGATVIYDESEAFYDVGVRLKGSFVGRNVARVGFHFEFPADRLFRGEHRIVSADRSGHTVIGSVVEMLVKQIANHAGGIPGMYDDIARFIHCAQPTYNSTSGLRLTAYDNDWLDDQFKNGSAGPMFEVEVLRWNLTTVDGNPESPKQVGNESGGTGYANLEVRDWGADPESYRWFLLKVNNRTEDDFAGGIAWCRALGLTGTNFDARVPQVMDVGQWLRVMAFQSLVGPADAYYTGGNIHNFRAYVRPEDNKMLDMPWDWDSCFQLGATASLYGSGNIAKLLTNPQNHRQYLGHMNNLVRTTYNSAYMSRWTAHYGAVAQQDLSAYLSYINTRANYVLGQLPSAAFAITNNGGNNFTVTNGVAALRGTAPLSVDQILVNGTAYPVTWVSDTAWRLTVPLASGTNMLSLTTLDPQGRVLTNALDTIVVTNTGTPVLRPILINEWMADNAGPGGVPDPADGLFQDWFELFNPNAQAVNLGSYYLTDDLAAPAKWRLPTNTFITAGGFLLVWADGNTNQNPAGASTNADLHAGFSLNLYGEAIGLFAPDGVTPVSAVNFGPQLQNVSEGLYPDGNTNRVCPMLNYTPRAANSLAVLTRPQILSVAQTGATVTLTWTVLPERAYQLQAAETCPSTVWKDVGPPIRAAGPVASQTDVVSTNRFYRVVLLQ